MGGEGSPWPWAGRGRALRVHGSPASPLPLAALLFLSVQCGGLRGSGLASTQLLVSAGIGSSQYSEHGSRGAVPGEVQGRPGAYKTKQFPSCESSAPWQRTRMSLLRAHFPTAALNYSSAFAEEQKTESFHFSRTDCPQGNLKFITNILNSPMHLRKVQQSAPSNPPPRPLLPAWLSPAEPVSLATWPFMPGFAPLITDL